MDKPYVICHMVTSLDGKVTGDFLHKKEHSVLIEEYYRLHREYNANGFLCGRVTMENSFPQPPVMPPPYAGPSINREDYVAERVRPFTLSPSTHTASFGGKPTPLSMTIQDTMEPSCRSADHQRFRCFFSTFAAKRRFLSFWR